MYYRFHMILTINVFLLTYTTLHRSDIVCTVHLNQLRKQTNKIHFCMYLFYNFCTLYMFRTTISFIIRSPQVTVSAALYKPCKRLTATEQLGTFAWFVQS